MDIPSVETAFDRSLEIIIQGAHPLARNPFLGYYFSMPGVLFTHLSLEIRTL
jgi:hypothetical protein